MLLPFPACYRWMSSGYGDKVTVKAIECNISNDFIPTKTSFLTNKSFYAAFAFHFAGKPAIKSTVATTSIMSHER